MHKLMMAATVAAAALATPCSQAASTFTPGVYSVTNKKGTEMMLCLRADGSWFGDYFGWGGKWVIDEGYGLVMTGGMAGGKVNDTFHFYANASGKLDGIWAEWTDDGKYNGVITDMIVKDYGRSCEPGEAFTQQRAPRNGLPMTR